MRFWFCTLLILVGIVDSISASELPSHPLTFSHWKRVQVHNYQQEVVKKSKEIKGLGKSLLNESLSSEDKEVIEEKLKSLKETQKLDLAKLQFSKELTFEEYFDVYLKQYSNNKEALKFIASRLSKSSVAYLLERSMIGERKVINKEAEDKVKEEESSGATSAEKATITLDNK